MAYTGSTMSIAINYTLASTLSLDFSRVEGGRSFTDTTTYTISVIEDFKTEQYIWEMSLSDMLWDVYTQGEQGIHFLLPSCSNSGYTTSTYGATVLLDVYNSQPDYLNATSTSSEVMEGDSIVFNTSYSINYRELPTNAQTSLSPARLLSPITSAAASPPPSTGARAARVLPLAIKPTTTTTIPPDTIMPYVHSPSSSSLLPLSQYSLARDSVQRSTTTKVEVVYGNYSMYDTGTYTFDFITTASSSADTLNKTVTVEVVFKSVDSVSISSTCIYAR